MTPEQMTHIEVNKTVRCHTDGCLGEIFQINPNLIIVKFEDGILGGFRPEQFATLFDLVEECHERAIA